MSLLLASLVVVAFAVTLERWGIVTRAREALARARDSYAVVRDTGLTDDAKGKALRQHAVRLFSLAAVIVFGAAAALALPIGILWLLDRAGVADLSEVLEILGRVDFLVVATIVGVVSFKIVGALGRS